MIAPAFGHIRHQRRHPSRPVGLIEAEADYAQRQRERASQQAELASSLAARLGAGNVETRGGLLLRTLLHPAKGGRRRLLGMGIATAGEAIVCAGAGQHPPVG